LPSLQAETRGTGGISETRRIGRVRLVAHVQYHPSRSLSRRLLNGNQRAQGGDLTINKRPVRISNALTRSFALDLATVVHNADSNIDNDCTKKFATVRYQRRWKAGYDPSRSHQNPRQAHGIDILRTINCRMKKAHARQGQKHRSIVGISSPDVHAQDYPDMICPVPQAMMEYAIVTIRRSERGRIWNQLQCHYSHVTSDDVLGKIAERRGSTALSL
jgi:hypothetical protein